MKHLYEIFEKFPDGSSLWTESAKGSKKAQHKLLQKVTNSKGEFYAIDLDSGEVLKPGGNGELNKKWLRRYRN